MNGAAFGPRLQDCANSKKSTERTRDAHHTFKSLARYVGTDSTVLRMIIQGPKPGRVCFRLSDKIWIASMTGISTYLIWQLLHLTSDNSYSSGQTETVSVRFGRKFLPVSVSAPVFRFSPFSVFRLKHYFRPKQPVSPKIPYFGRFWQHISV